MAGCFDYIGHWCKYNTTFTLSLLHITQYRSPFVSTSTRLIPDSVETALLRHRVSDKSHRIVAASIAALFSNQISASPKEGGRLIELYQLLWQQ